MSVFKCKMCGGSMEIDDNQTVVFCEYCGTKQVLSVEPLTIVPPVTTPVQKRKVPMVLLAVAVATLSAVVLLLAVRSAGNEKKEIYDRALRLYADGQYDLAIESFLSLEDYRDSEELIVKCREKQLDEAYDAAVTRMEQGDYAEAIAAFSELNGYRDSLQQIESCKTAILEGRYESAVAFMEAGSYAEAAAAFAVLGDYQDSTERLADCEAILETGTDVGAADNIVIGDYVTFGTYEQDNQRQNGREPIEWRVLDKDGSRILVVSKYALDCRQYHNVDRGNTAWSDSSIRKWLNRDFLQAAFTEAEQAMIPTVTIENPDNPRHGTEGGKATEDQIFLLSVQEAYRYFSSDWDRQCERTDYALACGVTKYNSGCVWWWLRTPGVHENTAAGVYPNGEITLGGDYVSCGTDAVRPAMWIDLG